MNFATEDSWEAEGRASTGRSTLGLALKQTPTPRSLAFDFQ